MRPLVLAVLLLSCAGDDVRRAPDRAPAAPSTPWPRSAATPAVAVLADRAPSAPPPAAPALPPDPRTATRLAAHDALAANCGECHEGHRSKVAKALAIFDLDLADWPTRFDTHRFESALRRLDKKPDARAAFIAFRDAELAAAPPTGVAAPPAGAPAAAAQSN
jgi:hypothetical protein